MYLRCQNFESAQQESLFLWGARQTGKSTLLAGKYQHHRIIDLLMSDVFERYRRNPSLLREELISYEGNYPIIIDEIQKIPDLLNEVHWLIVNQGTRFILSGSSPRKILRSGTNLLGGRALRYELYPLIKKEIPDFDLLRALNHGLLPRHYLSDHPQKLLSAYLGSYLQDEIIAEAKIRNIPSFTHFLEVAAFSNGEMVNYSNIATDCGVSAPTIKEYFQILEDSLLGRFLPSFQKKPKRRVIQSPRFYYFDVGVANYLLKRQLIQAASESFGKAFEHYIYHELYAHRHYSQKDYSLSYWRTTSGLEVDFILGDHEVAIEVKATQMAQERHLKGLKKFTEEYTVNKLILVSNDPIQRKIGNVDILPWNIFLEKLWADEII
ncbi:MAG: ATP-binding protein [Cyclobacteriaceae bacterium]|nr:ATP-binding protein [Cyclobacteriaceae bacterium]